MGMDVRYTCIALHALAIVRFFWFVFSNSSDVLLIKLINKIFSFLYAVFKVHSRCFGCTQPPLRFIEFDWLPVIRNQKPFWPLITGNPSYANSTALLIGLALISCCSSLPVSILIFNICSGSASVSFLRLAATYSPTPSPVQYHRPLRS